MAELTQEGRFAYHKRGINPAAVVRRPASAAVSVTSSQAKGAISLLPTRPARLSETDRASAGELDPVITPEPPLLRALLVKGRWQG